MSSILALRVLAIGYLFWVTAINPGIDRCKDNLSIIIAINQVRSTDFDNFKSVLSCVCCSVKFLTNEDVFNLDIYYERSRQIKKNN